MSDFVVSIVPAEGLASYLVAKASAGHKDDKKVLVL